MKRAASIASIAFLTVMIAFIFFGMGLLNGIGISLYGFQIAGGLFLMRTGFEMIYNDLSMGDEGEKLKGSLVGISIMPITIPVPRTVLPKTPRTGSTAGRRRPRRGISVLG